MEGALQRVREFNESCDYTLNVLRTFSISLSHEVLQTTLVSLKSPLELTNCLQVSKNGCSAHINVLKVVH